MHLCISSEDNQRYRVASAPETTKSRRALLFEEEMSGGGMRDISKAMNSQKKASRGQLLTVSSNPRSTGQQASLSGSSFKGQRNSCVHNTQLICGLPCQRPFVG